ncbi:hypothetical protein NXX22_02895 [Bacteroides thetaiotaomicron]|nr:hypothetical protein [Bacteroides thetaiotaomicron]MCS2781484.1 hypothetical protein [Bacteroides thetaiotaomicron]
MMTWSAMKLPDGLRSSIELRICGTSSVCCGDMPRTPSASGLTSCPSFSFSATLGVGGASSNCILRSSAASSTSTVSVRPPYDTDTAGLRGFPTSEGKPALYKGKCFSWLLKTF